MNKSILIVLGGAVAVAVLVAMLVQVSLGNKKPVVQEEAKMEILVASKDLGIGHELAPGDLRWQSWPKGSVFPGVITKVAPTDTPEKALEGRLRRDVASGEPILKTSVLGESQGNFVAASLEAGMRAVALKVSPESTAGGFIGPGDFVDIVLTYDDRIQLPDDDPRVASMLAEMISKKATETILQNIKVLAVDQTATRPEDEKIKVGKTVTVAVTVQEAERLALAGEVGELTLSLRGVGDNAIVKKEWPTTTDARITSISDEFFTEYVKMKKSSGASGNSVRIYNGDQVSTTQP